MTTPLNLKSVAVQTVVVFAALAFLYHSCFVYFSSYQYAQAEAGRKTMSDYRALVASAAAYNNAAAMKLVDIHIANGALDEALTTLQSTPAGTRTWRVWEREGIIREKMAVKAIADTQQARKAAQLYDKVLKVNPRYETGLERRALLALKLGDYDQAKSFSADIIGVNKDNFNAMYIKAKALEGEGRKVAARDLYRYISAVSHKTSGPVFSQREIIEAISGSQDKPQT